MKLTSEHKFGYFDYSGLVYAVDLMHAMGSMNPRHARPKTQHDCFGTQDCWEKAMHYIGNQWTFWGNTTQWRF